MSLQRIPPGLMRENRARAIARRVTCWGATPVLLLLAACGDSSGPVGDGGGATLSGTVRAAGSSAALADATVSVGARQATSDANGRFELTRVPIGAATVRAARPGYLPAEAAVTVIAGANSHDFTLTPQEIYVLGTNAVYVPAGGGPMRGAIIVLGGPVASGFVTGERIAPADNPDLEVSLQALGASLRALARSAHVALLGSSTTGMENSATSDNALFLALSTAVGASGQAEIAATPVLMFGLSSGAREAAGLVSRHPERAIGLLERVPVEVTALTAPAALAVPTFVMQAELDEVVSNTVVRTTFSGNRSRGGLWALAVEPEVGHRVATSRGNAAAISWITTVLTLRLPTTPGDPLIALAQPAGWLGDQTTLEIAPWADYLGDRAAASWLLSESAATSWKSLGTPEDIVAGVWRRTPSARTSEFGGPVARRTTERTGRSSRPARELFWHGQPGDGTPTNSNVARIVEQRLAGRISSGSTTTTPKKARHVRPIDACRIAHAHPGHAGRMHAGCLTASESTFHSR